MISNEKLGKYAAATIISLFLLMNAVYVVDERQQAIVFQFGEIVEKPVVEAGLHLKIPFIQNVTYFDKRILNVYADEKEIIAKDRKRLIVNAFAKYQISDALTYYKAVSNSKIQARFNSIFESSIREVLGKEPLSALLTNKRAEIMSQIQELMDQKASNFGVKIVDIRILRADLPKENSAAIYRRMQTEREKEAREIRAEGEEEGQVIKSKADKEAKILLAEANKQSNILKGQGEAKASVIYAQAFGKDPEFFEFYRTMTAYQKTLKKSDTKMILSPASPFLKLFNSDK